MGEVGVVADLASANHILFLYSAGGGGTANMRSNCLRRTRMFPADIYALPTAQTTLSKIRSVTNPETTTAALIFQAILVSVIAVFWATIPNPTRPRVADSGTPYRYIG